MKKIMCLLLLFYFCPAAQITRQPTASGSGNFNLPHLSGTAGTFNFAGDSLSFAQGTRNYLSQGLCDVTVAFDTTVVITEIADIEGFKKGETWLISPRFNRDYGLNVRHITIDSVDTSACILFIREMLPFEMFITAVKNNSGVSSLGSFASGGFNNIASMYSHTEGYGQENRGNYSHLEGFGGKIKPGADYSHAEGLNAEAALPLSHVQSNARRSGSSQLTGFLLSRRIVTSGGNYDTLYLNFEAPGELNKSLVAIDSTKLYTVRAVIQVSGGMDSQAHFELITIYSARHRCDSLIKTVIFSTDAAFDAHITGAIYQSGLPGEGRTACLVFTARGPEKKGCFWTAYIELLETRPW